MGKLPFREIHLDFHTNETIENIGINFHPEEFVKTLKNAHVNSVTLFARCHHGMLYYDSKKNPERIHPHLVNKNLLKDQIEACHKADIRTPIYTTVQWDYYTAQRHREWLCIDENGQSIGESGAVQRPLDAGFYESLCLNTGYREFLKAHVEEILDTFAPVDGLFLDIVFPVPCACPACRAKMEKKGFNSFNRQERLEFYKETIHEWQKEMTGFIHSKFPGTPVFYNRGHVGTDQRISGDTYTHFELESLPSGTWGYLHFPTTVRYARILGKEYLSHTGKFHTMWGDFNSYKNQPALEFECFNMLAMGAKCLIGDQLNPDGRLSESVYKLIGKVYRQVEEKEKWCDDVDPVVEIGVFTPEEFVGASNNNLPKSLRGAVRILQECGYQFNVIDTKENFEKYRLLILPDEIPVDPQFADKLAEYIKNDGSLLCTCKSGLKPDSSDFAIDMGVEKSKEQPTDLYGKEVAGRIYDRGDYCQYILPGSVIGGQLPKDYHVMYSRGLNVETADGAEVLLESYASVFDRDYRHFCSHRQSPCSGEAAYPAVVKKGKCIYFSHPIFTQYQYNAPLWYKKIIEDAIDLLLNDRILTHNGPSTLLTTVNDQLRENRRVVHLLHYIPERRCQTIDVIEDVIPIYNIQCRLETPQKVKSVSCQPQNTALPYNAENDHIVFTVPEVNGHQMIEILFVERENR